MRQVTPSAADRLRSTPVFDTPSGLGGTFTVAILEEREGGRVLVSVCYGCFRDAHSPWESWRDWDGAQFEADNARLIEQLEALGVSRYSIAQGHCLGDPEQRSGLWELPSRQFQFPVATALDDTGRRYVFLADQPLRNHPFVQSLEAAGIEVHDYAGERTFGTGENGRWHHAVDLINAGEVEGLIATREFADDGQISEAVGFALGHKGKLTTAKARKVMALFNWPEISPAMMREFLDTPSERCTGENKTGWPVRFKTDHANLSHGRAWCYIVGLERGWFTYVSGFAQWSAAGKAWWAGESAGLL